MAYYIGIDLGTTNSAIVTFDGEKTRVWKTKDQTDVTPSCIFIDKRGRQFVGIKLIKRRDVREMKIVWRSSLNALWGRAQKSNLQIKSGRRSSAALRF